MDGRPVSARREDGFTLVELLIGVAIAGMLITVIGSAMVVGLKTTDATTQRLSESHDAQVTSAYLANDVQSATSVNVSNAGTLCSVTGTPTDLVSFSYQGGQTATYRCGTTGGQTQVTRSFGGSTLVLAHFAGTARPSVTCTPSPCTSTPLDSVALSFAESSGYAYSLLGSRRAFNVGGGSGTPSTPDLTLLATGSSPLWIAGGCSQGQINQGDCIVDPDTPNSPSDNPSLTINGNLYVNANLNNAVRLTGKKNATKLFISNGGVFKILNPGGCSGCTHNTVTCAACTWVTGNQPYSNYSPALLDPLRFMSYPTSGTTGSCSGNTCNPGVYNSTLSLNSTTAFNPGVYILNNGIKVTGNNTKITGNGVMLFINGGSFDLGGGSQVNLTPQTSGPYKNVLVFQSRTNMSALKITGGASAGLTFGGIIYAPASTQVTLSTGGAALSVTAVVAQNVKVAGSAQVTIG